MEITGFEATEKPVVQKRAIVQKVPNIFNVPLESYAYQPWSTRGSYLSQWFNYGLTPTTWSAYATMQTNQNKTK